MLFRFMRRGGMLGIGLVAAVLGTLLVAAPAATAADPAALYDYTDPNAAGCAADATTIFAKDLTNPADGTVTGRLELRYSHSCQTNWVRINNYVQGATATKIIERDRTNRPEGGTNPYAYDSTSDTYYGWSWGLELYAPSYQCVSVGGTITLNGQVIGSNGQAPDLVC